MSRLTESTHPAEQRGLVISYFGNSVAVEADDGQVFQCHLRRNQALPVVGDRVIWTRDSEQTGIVVRILPRRSQLTRGDGKHKTKAIAANLDEVIIVMAPPPIFSDYLVDRYLVAAALLKLGAVIVLNKIDLCDAAAQEQVEQRLSPYQKIDYPVFLSSTYTGDGMAALAAQLAGKSAVLVGPSGVGKSSIIASLAATSIKIGDTSATGAGKHTTTATRLYHLPRGGCLIDSPGVREFNLWPVKTNDILCGFTEFQPYATACKFRDCQHLAEPGCAVQSAVVDGKISVARMTSYRTLMREAAANEKNDFTKHR